MYSCCRTLGVAVWYIAKSRYNEYLRCRSPHTNTRTVTSRILLQPGAVAKDYFGHAVQVSLDMLAALLDDAEHVSMYNSQLHQSELDLGTASLLRVIKELQSLVS